MNEDKLGQANLVFKNKLQRDSSSSLGWDKSAGESRVATHKTTNKHDVVCTGNGRQRKKERRKGSVVL